MWGNEPLLLYCNSPLVWALAPPSTAQTQLRVLTCKPFSVHFTNACVRKIIFEPGRIWSDPHWEYPVYNFDTFQGCAALNCMRKEDDPCDSVDYISVINKYIYIYTVCVSIFLSFFAQSLENKWTWAQRHKSNILQLTVCLCQAGNFLGVAFTQVIHKRSEGDEDVWVSLWDI